MGTKFITDEFERAININVIDATFPKLLEKHKQILSSYMYGVIQMIAICHGFYKERDKFELKLRQNSYKDLRWLLTFLLPYIDQNKVKMSELTDLEELYTLRYDTVDSEVRKKVQEYNVE